MMNPARDQLFASLTSDIEAFQFDARVTAVFADMIRRSVPGYASVIAMTGVIAAETVQPGGRVYDLGCSLGTGLISVYDRLNVASELIGVDNSTDMLKACEQNLASLSGKPNIQIKLICKNICDIEIQDASLVVMNYTLQFIPLAQRLALLKKICQGLKPGGALILSEKLVFEDPEIDTHLNQLYYDFKRHNGYSKLEISQKRQALENVLIPETQSAHLARLQSAGFKQTMSWFQCLNFYSFVAYK